MVFKVEAKPANNKPILTIGTKFRISGTKGKAVFKNNGQHHDSCKASAIGLFYIFPDLKFFGQLLKVQEYQSSSTNSRTVPEAISGAMARLLLPVISLATLFSASTALAVPRFCTLIASAA